MVSKARLDLPEPDSPVMTTSALRGSLRWRSLRLCSRAPETTISPLWINEITSVEPAPARTRVRIPLVADFAQREARGSAAFLSARAGVDLVQQGLGIVQLEVLAQVAGRFGARTAVKGHLEGEQARALGGGGLWGGGLWGGGLRFRSGLLRFRKRRLRFG